MNRLFGTGKKKAPPPNLTDAIANVTHIYNRLYIIIKFRSYNSMTDGYKLSITDGYKL